eukprot:CAMPEP_0168344490 /NCGR_PEP_ID=MMETSP0213-20121227/16860_1 /TAXON_ID=151035 /ORGANISM="Euplotes harpa, Strain FSP1.4" /LENGTH=184 /DNA_ID=CAMNT_0008352267 /DNA_START=8 /DNA_END=562 /DNA_ORIENTATION=-
MDKQSYALFESTLLFGLSKPPLSNKHKLPAEIAKIRKCLLQAEKEERERFRKLRCQHTFVKEEAEQEKKEEAKCVSPVMKKVSIRLRGKSQISTLRGSNASDSVSRSSSPSVSSHSDDSDLDYMDLDPLPTEINIKSVNCKPDCSIPVSGDKTTCKKLKKIKKGESKSAVEEKASKNISMLFLE